MSKKFNILALAGAAALGIAMLSPVSADAKGFGGHGGGFHGGGFKMHGGGHVHIRPHFRPHWHVGFRRHYWIAPAVTYAVARPAVAAVPGPCTCLSKEYTPQGQVLFKDRCTNEAAINPPLQQQSAVEQPTYQQPQSAANYQQQPSNMLPQQPVR